MKRSPLTRRTPLRSLSAKRAAKAPKYRHLRALVHAREGGCCASCRAVTPISEGHCHHRLLRSRGGLDDAANCVWLCAPCHDAAHMLPEASTRLGWMVPAGVDPASWPVKRADGWEQPGPDGWIPAEPHERQVAA